MKKIKGVAGSSGVRVKGLDSVGGVAYDDTAVKVRLAAVESGVASVGGNVTAVSDRVAVVEQKGMRQLLSTNVQFKRTGATTEALMYSGTIPGNSIGVNGAFHILANWSWTDSVNVKNMRIKFNGTTVSFTSVGPQHSMKVYTVLFNRGQANKQFIPGPVSGSGNLGFNVASPSVPVELAIDTSQQIAVTVTLQVVNAAEFAAMESLQIFGIG